jgi:hypothetical protein
MLMASTLRFACLTPLLLAALACGPADGAQEPGGGAGSSNSGGSGNPAGAGSGGSGSTVTLAGSGQALGGGDQGMAFGPGDVVQIEPPMAAGSNAGGSGGSGGSGIPGDGKSMEATLRRGMSGTALFTQTGEDVTMELKVTGCSDGSHTITINDGYACDAAVTEGVPWGERGTGFGPLMCSGNSGMLTYTRSGADKTKNWTVADHVQETDVTAHVLIISDGADVRAGCANFF